MRHAFCSFGLVLAVLLALGSTCCETEWAEDIEDEAEDFGWYDEKPSPRIRIEEDPQENGIKKENTSAEEQADKNPKPHSAVYLVLEPGPVIIAPQNAQRTNS